METKTTPAPISLDSLNLIKPSADGFLMDVLAPGSDKPIGVKLKILGDHSDVVQGFTKREVNSRRQQAAQRIQKGSKHIEVESVEDEEAFVIEACVVRTVGWEGLKEPFNAENARRLFTINPLLRAQVLNASGNAANFIKL